MKLQEFPNDVCQSRLKICPFFQRLEDSGRDLQLTAVVMDDSGCTGGFLIAMTLSLILTLFQSLLPMEERLGNAVDSPKDPGAGLLVVFEPRSL